MALAAAGVLAGTGLSAASTAIQVSSLTGNVLLSAVEVSATTGLRLLTKKIEHEDVKLTLLDLDVEPKLRTVKALVFAVRKRQFQEGSFIDVCLQTVMDIVEDITQNFREIHNKVAYHQTKYFSSWRSPDVEDNLKLLRSQNRAFDKRVDTLVKCLTIPINVIGKSEGERSNRKNTKSALQEYHYEFQTQYYQGKHNHPEETDQEKEVELYKQLFQPESEIEQTVVSAAFNL